MWASCLFFTALCISQKAASSQLHGGAKAKPAWSQGDSSRTEEVLKESFQHLDKVQNDILKAADEELQKEKSLPTLAEATTHWDASKFAGPDPAVPAKQSLLQTGRKDPEQDYANVVDFSELDKLRSKVDQADSRMASDFQAIQAQGAKDQALAAALGKSASFAQRDPTERLLQERAGLPKDRAEEVAWPERDQVNGVPEAVDAGEMASIIERGRGIPQGGHPDTRDHSVPVHAQSLGEAMTRLDTVRSNLARIEEGMAAKAKGASPESAYLKSKLESLLALSGSARKLFTHASEETDPAAKLARFEHMKEALKGLKAELHEHFHHVSQVPHGISLVEQAQTPDGGYAQIEKNLESLHSRIQSQVGALNREAKQATANEVKALDSMGPKMSEQYKFAWANDLPEDANMRTAAQN